MKLTFGPRGTLEIDDAKIIFRNFRGEKTQYNNEGNRNFSIVIPNMEFVTMLQNDVNEDGVGWNVKIKEGRTPEEGPFCHLPVKVSFNSRGPKVYLESSGRKRELNESSVHILDEIDISHVDLVIRPYDSEVRGESYRTAYLQEIWVVQEVGRFANRMAEEEYPEED